MRGKGRHQRKAVAQEERGGITVEACKGRHERGVMRGEGGHKRGGMRGEAPEWRGDMGGCNKREKRRHERGGTIGRGDTRGKEQEGRHDPCGPCDHHLMQYGMRVTSGSLGGQLCHCLLCRGMDVGGE